MWPWENHPWERELCRYAKKYGIKTIGYQHAVIGPQQFNPGPASNPDGFTSIPDRIICSGPAYYKQLIRWGIPAAFLCIFFILLIENFKFPKIFVTLGDASYSLYLIHPYIIQFFYKITGLDDQNFLVNCLFTFLIIIITLYISVLVFKLIEKPTNNLLRGFLRIT